MHSSTRDDSFSIGNTFNACSIVPPTSPARYSPADNLKSNAGFVQFGSMTTTQRDALTAANGMVIYNSSDNKFQGYENGAWVNLV